MILPSVWLESRGSRAEPTLVLGTAPTPLLFGSGFFVGDEFVPTFVWMKVPKSGMEDNITPLVWTPPVILSLIFVFIFFSSQHYLLPCLAVPWPPSRADQPPTSRAGSSTTSERTTPPAAHGQVDCELRASELRRGLHRRKAPPAARAPPTARHGLRHRHCHELGARERRDGGRRERTNCSGAAMSLEFWGTEWTRLLEVYSPGSRSAPAALHPNSHRSGSALLCSRGSPTKHTVSGHMVMWTVCMLREDLVDGDMDLLHVERSVSIMCSGTHLYSWYRLPK
jgi:hypothetical protein